MASISRESKGRRTIQFVGADKKRRSIRLGKVSQRTAEATKVRVEHLVAARITGHALDDETARWVANLDDVLRDKLSAVGLVPKREAITLAAFIDGYIASRGDVKPATATVYGHTRRNLVEHFGADKLLRDITPGDADEWRLSLVNAGLADNTVRRRSGIAKQFFTVAVRRKLISSNPFADLVAVIKANTSRLYFVRRDEARKVLDACPDAQWRLLFALSRYGGLRCPSEHLALRWGDVDWERSRITVRSAKTEHHVGGDKREIPLYPELLPYLRDVFEEAEPGAEYVITRYRESNANLRTQLNRIIRRAGLEPWPKLFQNLRSTRETELAEEWPMHVVCRWMGNSQPVATKHYLQVTDEHFERAVQNPVQHPPVSDSTGSQDEDSPQDESAFLGSERGDAGECDFGHSEELGDTGLEPVTSAL
jgi:integrase